MSDDSWSSKIAFRALCEFFESVSNETSKPKKKEKLDRFFVACRSHMTNTSSSSNKVFSLFPVVRLLMPNKDEERGVYGIKETVLARLFIDLLKLGPNSSDALKLKNYRAPTSHGATTSSSRDAGDFAAVLYTVVKDRAYEGEKVTLEELNTKLDDMIEAKARDGSRGVERVLMDLFRKLSGVQLKWLVRIILKDLKLGLGPDTILNQIHPDAKELFNVNGNLRKVCETLKDPKVRLNEIEITIFNPFKPMLAEAGKLDQVESQMGNKEFYIETKYDGERMQAHINGNNFKFFSRNGKDFTDEFGDVPESGKFCKYLSRCLAPSLKNAILDGEICAFNHVTETLCTKGVQNDIRHIQDGDPTYQQCLYLYDIVYLNGTVLTNLPLRERLERLKEAVPVEMKGRVQFADRKLASRLREVTESLNSAIDRLEEGLVLKDPDSVYKPNVRNKGGWVKIKPEYSNELMDMPDLVILGGYYASGRRLSGIVSHFILGVAVKGNGQTVPTEFRSFCRVGSGYSNKDLFSLLQKLQPHFRKGGIPSHLKFGREKPDVWIDPKKSVVVQIKAAEIVTSDGFDVGCTLRFPRVEQVRYDKSWTDCMTLEELQSLRGRSDGRLARKAGLDEFEGGDGDDDEDGAPANKRSRRTQTQRTQKPAAAVSSVYKAVDAKDVEVVSDDLSGKVIVIEPSLTDGGQLKKRLERIALKYGAIVEQNVSEERTFCYVTTVEKIKAKSVIRSQMYDVVKSSWLLDCDSDFRPFCPYDMLYTTEKTQRLFDVHYDKFGDGYSVRSTLESLKFSMSKVSESGASLEGKLTPGDLAEFEHENFPDDFKYGMFRKLTIYVDKFLLVGDHSTGADFHPLDVIELTLKFYGARIVASPDVPELTHVVVRASDLERLEELKKIRRERRKKFHIVTDSWVEDSLQEAELQQELDYEPL